ncbi:transcriptional repressor p66-alpha-like [Phyllobates terribilis]|uniref:transcriptional repressor p66-alpha-like n=1 Tax=Phyllobates terribilis TaxID=111132 RepID=UPI003CCAB766
MNGLTKAQELNSETFLLIQRSSPEERERLIKQLNEELRLEEAKLVLLKKLRQSQIQKETAPRKVPSCIGGTVIPPPLVRGGQQTPGKQSTQIVMPPLVRGAQQLHSIRQHPSTGPPPLLLAPRASVPSVQMQGQRIIQQGLIPVANVANTSLLVNIPQASPTSLKGSAGTTGNATSISSGSTNESPTPISLGLSGTTRGVLHTFPPTTKLSNAATLANRSVKPGERSVNKANLTSRNWKKSPINAGQTSSQRVIATQQSKKQSVEMHRGGTLAFVNTGLTVHKSASVDRQREYLLDMIPSRSITQSSTWK